MQKRVFSHLIGANSRFWSLLGFGSRMRCLRACCFPFCMYSWFSKLFKASCANI